MPALGCVAAALLLLGLPGTVGAREDVTAPAQQLAPPATAIEELRVERSGDRFLVSGRAVFVDASIATGTDATGDAPISGVGGDLRQGELGFLIDERGPSLSLSLSLHDPPSSEEGLARSVLYRWRLMAKHPAGGWSYHAHAARSSLTSQLNPEPDFHLSGCNGSTCSHVADLPGEMTDKSIRVIVPLSTIPLGVGGGPGTEIRSDHMVSSMGVPADSTAYWLSDLDTYTFPFAVYEFPVPTVEVRLRSAEQGGQAGIRAVVDAEGRFSAVLEAAATDPQVLEAEACFSDAACAEAEISVASSETASKGAIG